MDERQIQIRERAGLEESRYNQDFIEWLRKWGTPIMLVVALVAVAYTLRDRWHKAAENKVDQGFQELEAVKAGGNASPDALLALAAEYEGVQSISSTARLDAADAYLDALRRGVKPGAEVAVEAGKEGTLAKPDDALNDADRASFLGKAAELYQKVHDESSGKAGWALQDLNALYGLAAVSEGRQEFDKAKGFYEQVAKVADANQMPAHSALAAERIKGLEALREMPKVYAKADLPPAPEREKPKPAPAPPSLQEGGAGLNIQPVPTPGLGNPGGFPMPSPTANPAGPATAPAGTPPAPAPGTPGPESAPSTPTPAPAPTPNPGQPPQPAPPK